MAGLKDVEDEIRRFSAAEKRQLLKDLPRLLDGVSRDDEELLKLAEAAFKSWDNEEDAVYDDL